MSNIYCLNCDSRISEDESYYAEICDTEEVVRFCTRECRHVWLAETSLDAEISEGEMLDDGFALLGEGE